MKARAIKNRHSKRHSQLWDRADLDTSSILLDLQSFTEKPVIECAFAHPILLFLSYLVKRSIDRVSVIYK